MILGNDFTVRSILKNTIVINFLKANGISDAEISIAAPGIVDMQGRTVWKPKCSRIVIMLIR